MKNHNYTTVSLTTGTIFRIFLVLIFFICLYFVKNVALIILASVVIASAIEPGARFLVKMKIPRTLAVLGIYASSIAVILGLFYFLIPTILQDTTVLLAKLPEYVDSADNFIPPEYNLLDGTYAIPGVTEKLSLREILGSAKDTIGGISNGPTSILAFLFGGVTSLIITIVLSFYLSVQENGVENFLRVVTPDAYDSYVVSLWKRSREKIGLWMQGQFLLGALVAVLVFLGLTLLGFKHALLLAVLAGIFEIIPLFGPILSAIPAIIVGFADGGVATGLLVTGLYVVIQQFENHLIYPLVVNKVVGISPVFVIIALLVGGKLAGFIGILLAVPVSTVLVEYYLDIQREKQRTPLA